jgi:hypothetical protein
MNNSIRKFSYFRVPETNISRLFSMAKPDTKVINNGDFHAFWGIFGIFGTNFGELFTYI